VTAREAARALILGVVLAEVLRLLIDGDGQGAARIWRTLWLGSAAAAFELGQISLAAERRYYEAVRA
jgi:hypothetical protein